MIQGENLLIYKRDEISSIPFPGMLDFPGGGREGNETPKECALLGFFFATEISEHEISNISFGNEGIFWHMIPIQGYFTHPKAVPHLKERLRVYLSSK